MKDSIVLMEMIDLYCSKKHGSPRGHLCRDCREVFSYSLRKAERCNQPNKFCSNCETKCYSKNMAEGIRDIMSYSWMWMALYHPILTIGYLREKFKTKIRSKR